MTWLKKAARVGYAAKGVTYLLIAILALQAALGSGSAESTPGALQSLEGPPGGGLMLLAVALGLSAYAFWKVYIAIADPEGDGWTKRSTAWVVAFMNAGFASEAFRLSLNFGAPSSQGDPTVHWSRVVMSHTAGVWAVGIAGVLVALYGVSQLVRAARSSVDDHLRRLRVTRDTKQWVVKACKFGIAARGVVFMLVGWFLVRAALETDPTEAKDFGRTLNELRQQPMGRTLLCVVAVGLLAYAIYQFLRARYERFGVQEGH